VKRAQRDPDHTIRCRPSQAILAQSEVPPPARIRLTIHHLRLADRRPGKRGTETALRGRAVSCAEGFGLEALHAAAAGPALGAALTPTFHRLPSPDEAAKPTEDEPVYEHCKRDPDPGPQHPPSVALAGVRKFDAASKRLDSNPVREPHTRGRCRTPAKGDISPLRLIAPFAAVRTAPDPSTSIPARRARSRARRSAHRVGSGK
jgi:hypothetical protein